MNSRRIITLVLAPMGAGKSTFVRRMQARDVSVRHIDRDTIAGDALLRSTSSGRSLTIEDLLAAQAVGERQFYAELESILSTSVPHVVVDYPPTYPAWAPRTVALARGAGRMVQLIGIRVDALKCFDVARARNANTLLGVAVDFDRNREMVRAWRLSYDLFPSQFCMAASLADTAYLYENQFTGGKMWRVAQWRRAVSAG